MKKAVKVMASMLLSACGTTSGKEETLATAIYTGELAGRELSATFTHACDS